MGNFAGNAIIAKAKTLFGYRLRAKDYEELSRFNSIPDVIGYLKKNNKFSNTLSNALEYSMHRGQLEDLIKKSYFDNLARIVKFVSTTDRKFYELDMIKREIEIVLSGVRSIISGNIEESIRELPVFFIKHASFNVDDIIKAMTMADLLKTLTNTRYYDLIYPFYSEDPNEIRYSSIEHSLYVAYHDLVIERINKYYTGKVKENLMDIYQSSVEIENIIKIYRLRKFYNASERDVLDDILTKNIRMSEQKLKDLIKLPNPDDILNVLSKSQFSEFKDQDEYIYIEYQAEKIKYNLAKRYMYFSTSPPIVYSVFLILNEIERQNIFNIIEGIRYGLEKEDIKKLLVY